MKWNPPDTEGVVKFLVEEKSFNEDRVRRAIERINASRGKSNQGAFVLTSIQFPPAQQLGHAQQWVNA